MLWLKQRQITVNIICHFCCIHLPEEPKCSVEAHLRGHVWLVSGVVSWPADTVLLMRFWERVGINHLENMNLARKAKEEIQRDKMKKRVRLVINISLLLVGIPFFSWKFHTNYTEQVTRKHWKAISGSTGILKQCFWGANLPIQLSYPHIHSAKWTCQRKSWRCFSYLFSYQ